MSKRRFPWLLAGGQVILAAGLLYWDHVDYERILTGSGFIPLTDHWSFAGGILLIIEFPAVVLILPLLFILPDQSDVLVDAIFLSAVFDCWSWVGFQFRRDAGATISLRQRLLISSDSCLRVLSA